MKPDERFREALMLLVFQKAVRFLKDTHKIPYYVAAAAQPTLASATERLAAGEVLQKTEALFGEGNESPQSLVSDFEEVCDSAAEKAAKEWVESVAFN